MSKLGKRMLQSIAEARAIARGEADPATYRIHVPSEIDVAGLRKRLGLSQAEFSERFGFNPSSVKDWEQGRASPTGPVRAYLKVIEREPKAVERALKSA
jgi:putative transcriptional regulator